jgi:hypothetical protein
MMNWEIILKTTKTELCRFEHIKATDPILKFINLDFELWDGFYCIDVMPIFEKSLAKYLSNKEYIKSHYKYATSEGNEYNTENILILLMRMYLEFWLQPRAIISYNEFTNPYERNNKYK